MRSRLSKERGRVIDFKEILYYYQRHHPTYASEYIMDLLLVYKKYRGKKSTLTVRRHAYLQVRSELARRLRSVPTTPSLGGLAERFEPR